MKIGVVGHGTVGSALARFFERPGRHDVAVYDAFLEPYASAERLAAVDACDIAFVAVPTPFDPRSGSCDVSAVRDVVVRLDVPLCIKSTVPPGTTDALVRETGKRIGFSPEYLGESESHPWREADDCGFLVVAGDATVRALVRSAYASSSASELRYLEAADARAAELAKYMENCYLATKVAFVNQFADLAAQAHVDFDEVRSIFLLDPRVGESHTRVTADRGFGGRCLPKDLAALVSWSGGPSHAPLIQAVLDYNASVREARRFAEASSSLK
ncbi:MAG: UDPglucose 6-dehydrogenase [Candidatus Eremiobacteraeota bacterium]|jgi:UDPglucose 6-dehydrogenase|nr:UDPglucose 6-dehydrogenase [Candidatus Eremiobacteraeota bacterium]